MISFYFITLFVFQLECIDGSWVIYPGLGIFASNDFYHATHRPLNLLPYDPDWFKPTFALYTPRNPTNPQLLQYNNSKQCLASNFDRRLRTKVIVHGFVTDNPDYLRWMRQIRDRFMKHNQFNVILVDWSKDNNMLSYPQSVVNARVVGEMLGWIIEHFINGYEVSPSSFHIIGDSLGAHIAGYAGKRLKGQLGHITGLDPAGALFDGIVTKGRLWHSDAQFVEVIHTDSGLGTHQTCGHVDLYPNGGSVQPGCNQNAYIVVVTHGYSHREVVRCNHERAAKIYLESISNMSVKPVAYQCKSYNEFLEGKCHDCGTDGTKCIPLGPETIRYHRFKSATIGKQYFMVTAERSPLIRYQYLINIIVDSKWSNLFTEMGCIKLKLVANNGAVESVDLKLSSSVLNLLDPTYHKVRVLGIAPGQLREIGLEWKRERGAIDYVFGGTLYVKHIDIIPLDRPMGYGKASRTSNAVRFEPEKYGIPVNEFMIITRKTKINMTTQKPEYRSDLTKNQDDELTNSTMPEEEES